MKNILSIDTVFGACAVGVIAGDRTSSRVIPMQRGQSERLMPMILDVVADADVTVQNLDLIVVNVGPGSFTGVRIGIATARAIALGLNIPVQGVCACDALADMARVNNIVPIGADMRVVINSQRGDYFVADYAAGVTQPIAPEAIRILADEADLTKIIIGADRITEQLSVPYPIILGALGVRLYADQRYLLHGKADPMYLRDADISIPKKAF